MKKTGRLKRLFSVVLAVLLFGGVPFAAAAEEMQTVQVLSLIHISEPTRPY